MTAVCKPCSQTTLTSSQIESFLHNYWHQLPAAHHVDAGLEFECRHSTLGYAWMPPANNKATIATSCGQFANQELQWLDVFTYRRSQCIYVGVLAEFRVSCGRFRSNMVVMLIYDILSYWLFVT